MDSAESTLQVPFCRAHFNQIKIFSISFLGSVVVTFHLRYPAQQDNLEISLSNAKAAILRPSAIVR